MEHFFLLTVEGDVEPSVERFGGAAERDFAAAQHRREDKNERDGLYPLTVTVAADGTVDVEVDSYAGEDSPCLVCGEPTFVGFCANPDCAQWGGIRKGMKVDVVASSVLGRLALIHGVVQETPADDEETVAVFIDALGVVMQVPRAALARSLTEAAA